jgi:hypothetical protein
LEAFLAIQSRVVPLKAMVTEAPVPVVYLYEPPERSEL